MKLGVILIVSFLIITLFAEGLGIIGLRELGSIETSLNRATQDAFPHALAIAHLAHASEGLRYNLAEYILLQDEDSLSRFDMLLGHFRDQEKIIIEIEEAHHDAQIQNEILDFGLKIVEMKNKVVLLKQQGKLFGDQINNLILDVEQETSSFISILDEAIFVVQEEVNNEAEAVFGSSQKIRTELTWYMFFVLLTAGVVAFLIVDYISGDLKNLTKKVDEVTHGRMDVVLRKSKISEIQNLIESLNRILASMKLAVMRKEEKGALHKEIELKHPKKEEKIITSHVKKNEGIKGEKLVKKIGENIVRSNIKTNSNKPLKEVSKKVISKKLNSKV